MTERERNKSGKRVRIMAERERGIRKECTDGNTAFGCDSDKNSLVFIYMF